MSGSNDALAMGHRGAFRIRAALALALVAGASGASSGADPAAEPPSFQPGDISIGEPIALPFERSAGDGPRPLPAGPRRAEGAALQVLPGNGWLGLVVAEAATPGRFAVAEVAADGPAAAAGIQAGDEVRAINGLPLRTSDDVAQALTAIAPGQQVRLAIAKGEQVGDVTLAAVPRPVAARDWGAADTPPAAQQALAAAAGENAAQPPFPATPLTTAVNVQTPPPQPLPSPQFSAPAAGLGVAATPPAMPTQPAVTAPQAIAAPPAFTPPSAAALPHDATRGRTALGVRTVPIDPSLQARFRLPQASGAYVIGVVGDLPASKAGVPPGSVIVALDNRPVRSPDELTQLVTAGPVGRPVPLEYVLPGGTPQRADVVLQTLEQPLAEALVGGQPTVTDVPTLQSQPTPATSRRPIAGPDAAAVRDEIRHLRMRLESLERRLEAAGR